VAKLLLRWGFTPQKPAFRAYEQSPKQLRGWLEHQYPALKRRAAKQGAVILWLDEVGMRSQHQAGTTYAEKGKTPVLQRTGKRFSLNMISAISNRGKMVFMVVDGTFNGVVFIRFLQKLLRSVNRKIFLIADSHPVHLEKKVEKWFREHKERIALIPLPTYSPEINPVEYFNQDLKTNAVGKTRPKNKQELKKLAEIFAKRKKQNPEKVKKSFHNKAVRYAL
jgi:transposase